MISLTYNFNPDTSNVAYAAGAVAVPNMTIFQPEFTFQGNSNLNSSNALNPLSFQSQAYVAHT